MSAFMCTDKHIATIAQNVGRNKYRTYTGNPPYENEAILLCQAMYQLNDYSLQCRYKEKADKVPPLSYWKQLLTTIPYQQISVVEFVKLCDCFLYQCSEAKDYRDDSTYKTIETARNYALYVTISDEYNKASWTI